MTEKITLVINWLSKDDELNQYRLCIYWLSWVRVIVVASDITLFPGKKVADITPQIIRAVENCFDLSSNQMMLVEHYPSASLHGELYLHVMCVNNEIMKYDLSKNELTQLIGKLAQHK